MSRCGITRLSAKNRDRLLKADIARELFANIVEQARVAGLLSDEHFTVDGTLIQAWASYKSFRSKDDSDDPPAGGPRNSARDFRGESRTNDTHECVTDPEAKLYKKSPGTPAKLAYLGHAVSENRNGLVVDVRVTEANGTAERAAALQMMEAGSIGPGATIGADKAYDVREFVREVRQRCITPHIAQNLERPGGSGLDARTTRHVGYRLSIKARKLIEEAFGWGKDIGRRWRSSTRRSFAALGLESCAAP